jgi:type IV secretory pathway TraG/TraD family ATPase VirD4
MLEMSLTRGWSGIAFAYSAVQLPMLVGLARARADLRHYAISPLLAAPLTAVAAMGAAISNAWIGHGGFGLQLAIGAAFSVSLGYAGGKVSAQASRKDPIHHRGSLVAERPNDSSTRARQNTQAFAITLAGMKVPAQDESKHFKLIGTTGTGKSTAIQEMLADALARGDRAVIADPDFGYFNRLHGADRGDVVLNPFDDRSVKWDLFAEINSPYDVEQLARSLIPDHEGQDRSWRAYARTFFTAVTRQVHEAGTRNVDELYRLLVVAGTGELRALVRGTPAQPFLDEHNSRMFDSIRSVTSSAVGALEYIGRQQGKSFSVREWVRDKTPGALFIPYKAGQIAALGSTISAWMRLAIFQTMDQDEQYNPSERPARDRLWFVVDELDALGQIDGLKDALARLRKFGGRCVLGFQSIAQVSSTYGHGDAHTIIENCGNSLILRCSASEGGGTARFASQLIGDREVLRTSVSKSRRLTELLGSVTHSEQFCVEAAVMPSQVEQLPDLVGYLKYASDPTWQRVRLDAVRTWGLRQMDQKASKNSRHAELGNEGFPQL